MIMKHAEDIGVLPRVTFLPDVPYWGLQSLCRTFSCGVLLIDDRRLNDRYCSPSKIFDYIAAQCPIVVSTVPPLTELSQSRGVGVVVSKRLDVPAVAAAVMTVVGNHALFQARCAAASADLDWHIQGSVVDTVVGLLCQTATVSPGEQA